MMIAGITQQTTEVATQVQYPSSNGGMGILGSSSGITLKQMELYFKNICKYQILCEY